MSHQRRVILKVVAGPNEGDTVSVEAGACRLIGRHLSENETAFIDRDGNRVLDAAATGILTEHLQERSPTLPGSLADPDAFSSAAFDRGPDIIFSDDSISRAHAMIFHDPTGVGIIDLASTNGTYVNNERITSALVTDGDVVTIGSSEMAVEIRNR